ncbi:hypothetical protein [Sinorhizobium meliloti]|uniref:hypothetical protein n=1 Tax=Rhizobium meliloti TaxID=382 RepID=UPI001F429747|nr:hypothetical protein [Sinorhizobium meliloti]
MARGTGKSGVEIAQEHVDALIEYLERHKDEPLPRYGVDLNKSIIAKECGFDRQVFRTNPRCAEILRDADDRDRKANLSRLEQAKLFGNRRPRRMLARWRSKKKTFNCWPRMPRFGESSTA